MKTGLKIASGLVVLIIAIAVAIVSVLSSMDYGRFKGDLSKMVYDATGRELTIAGDLQLALSLTPKLTVTGVSLANAPWAGKTPMVQLQRLDAQVALKPLLSGRLEVDFIELVGLDFTLQTDGKGKANWEFTPAKPQASESAAQSIAQGTAQKLKLTTSVRDVRLRNVHITYLDGATGAEVETDLKRADFTADHMDSPLKGNFVAIYNNVAVRARAELGSLGLLIASKGEPFPVDLKLSAPGLSADIVGTVDQPSAGMAVNMHINAQAQNSKTLSKLAGVDFPDVGALALKANVSGSGTAYSFKGLEATVGNSDLKGNADVDLSAKRPAVVAKLSSSYLDLNQLAGLNAQDDDDGPPLTRLFTTDPLPFNVLKTADADVSLTATRVRVHDLSITDVNAVAKLKDGKLRLQPLRLTFDEGRLNARVSVDGSTATPKVAVRASVRDLDAGTIAALFGQGRIVSLKLDGEVDVKSAGATPQAMAAGLGGSLNLIGRNGLIHDEKFKDLTEGIGSILPWAGDKDANAISCFMAKMPINKGDVVAETVLLDTSGVTVRVTGNVDLPGELLHLTVNTDAKKTSLATFAVPVRVKGPILEPRIDVDPADAVVGTVGNIVTAPAKLIAGLLSDTISLVESDKAKKEAAEKNDPCLQALGRGKTAEKTQAPPPATETPDEKAKDKSKSSGDPLKDVEEVGKALKKLF